jgi:FlaA1/EpsC-like NDP-sugar epimerase
VNQIPESGPLTGKRVLVTGGTGSLGRVLIRRILTGELGHPEEVTVFSRDEVKQHEMRLAHMNRAAATDDVVFEPARLHFRIGDVRDMRSLSAALRTSDIVFHAAALKQVPACEYAPAEAIQTNVMGAENLTAAIREQELDVEAVIGVTTDKACKPVNVLGMTKALQERILSRANLDPGPTRFLTARYGNVLASRGSVVPLFHEQIRNGGPVTITTTEMTRFLISLDDAVDTVFAALTEGEPGETYVPRAPAARITDLADALIGDRQIRTEVIGVRPGEKTHEVLVSEEEAPRTVVRGDFLAIAPILPELRRETTGTEAFGAGEYSSADGLLDAGQVRDLLARNQLAIDDRPVFHA